MRPALLPSFDPVEVVRSTVAALSLTAERVIYETHINRIQEVFSRTDLAAHTLKGALDGISDLREVEHLGKGYWLPTPTRSVPLNESTSLLVSIAPTTELQRHFSSVRRVGVGRIVAAAQVSDLPTQSLKSWRGTSNLNAAEQARISIDSAIPEFRPSIVPTDLVGFGVKSTGTNTQNTRREPGWFPFADRRVCSWNNVQLFRARLGPNYFRYFLGRLAGHALLEGPEVADNLSLQYGLASLLKQPLTVSMSLHGNVVSVRLPLTAPRSVRRLLAALCDADPKTFGYVWHCPVADCWPAVKSALQDLGCEIANHE